MNSENKNKNGLIRQLGLFDAAMIMVGIVLGSGIFLTTGIMAQSIPSPGLILLAWVVGGLLTLAGAFIYAELGAALPQAGGQYVYLREAYGSLIAFLFGWLLFLVYMTAGIAGLCVAFGEYFGYFFPSLGIDNIIFSADLNILGIKHYYVLSAGQIIGVTIIIGLTAVNYIGVIFGKTVQNILTVTKIGTLLIFVILGLFIGNKTEINLFIIPQQSDFGIGQLIMGFGVSLIAVSWAFDGWNNANLVAGEIKDPGRNIPRALIIGTLGVTLIYLLVNLVYFCALPMEELTGVVRIAEKASNALFGRTTTGVISAAILISVFGAINGSIFVGARVYYAMAKDGLFFKRVGEVHHRYKTPGFALIIQAVWASLITISGTFEQIITFAMFVSIMFWIAAAASVITLRKKYPDMPRPYKTWGYPVTPVIFIIASAGILINTLFEKPVEALAGIAITVLGIPVYYFWKNRSG
jgi:APA family basic amino acid/polyamine antiporter